MRPDPTPYSHPPRGAEARPNIGADPAGWVRLYPDNGKAWYNPLTQYIVSVRQMNMDDGYGVFLGQVLRDNADTYRSPDDAAFEADELYAESSSMKRAEDDAQEFMRNNSSMADGIDMHTVGYTDKIDFEAVLTQEEAKLLFSEWYKVDGVEDLQHLLDMHGIMYQNIIGPY